MADFCKIIMYCKSKVRFSAAKVCNTKRLTGCCFVCKLRKYIINEFEKEVYLAELVVAGRNNLAFIIHNSKQNQKRNRSAFG